MKLTQEKIKMSTKTTKNHDHALDNDVIRHVLEDHLPYMRNRASTHKIDKVLAHRFNHDLNGYLTSLNISLGHQWVYLRLNDMLHPWEFHEDMELLLFPHQDDINIIIGKHVSSY